MNSIATQIEMRIKRWKKGKIFFPEDFLDIAEYENVRKTAHLQSSVFKLSKDLIDSIHEEGIVAYTS